ncbi:MAG TPA: hypothetical protein VI953_00275 [Candidatus Paceibacterota bacterium]
MTETKELFVCLITGPAGAGKSSVTKALAAKYERCSVIGVDQIHNMIVSGYVRQWPWSEEVRLQTTLGAKNVCDLASNFMGAGFNVFIDGVVGEKLFNQYAESLAGKKFKAFLLLPSLEVVLKRFDEREVDPPLRERIYELHEKYTKLKGQLNWQVIDSTNQTLHQTVEQIYSEMVSQS